MWLASISENVDPSIKKILIGNKCDLKRRVPIEVAVKLAEKHGMQYYETSAKNDINVKESINELLDSVYEQKFEPSVIEESSMER